MLFELAQRQVGHARFHVLRDHSQYLPSRFVEDRTFKLLVIDSVMNLFRKFRCESSSEHYSFQPFDIA